jgi:hypothetical protein
MTAHHNRAPIDDDRTDDKEHTMTGGDWALIIGAGFWGVLVIGLCVVLIRTLLLIDQAVVTVRDISNETVGLLGGLNETVAGVNVELARVDTIIAGVQSITATTDQLVGVVHATVSNPLIKSVAFVAGAAQGAKKLRA